MAPRAEARRNLRLTTFSHRGNLHFRNRCLLWPSGISSPRIGTRARARVICRRAAPWDLSRFVICPISLPSAINNPFSYSMSNVLHTFSRNFPRIFWLWFNFDGKKRVLTRKIILSHFILPLLSMFARILQFYKLTKRCTQLVNVCVQQQTYILIHRYALGKRLDLLLHSDIIGKQVDKILSLCLFAYPSVIKRGWKMTIKPIVI